MNDLPDLPLHLRVVAEKLEQEGFVAYSDLEDEDPFDGADGDPIFEEYRDWQLCAVHFCYLHVEATHPDATHLWIHCDKSVEFQTIDLFDEPDPTEIDRITKECLEENLRQQLIAIDWAKRLIDQALEKSAQAAGQFSIPGVMPCSD